MGSQKGRHDWMAEHTHIQFSQDHLLKEKAAQQMFYLNCTIDYNCFIPKPYIVWNTVKLINYDSFKISQEKSFTTILKINKILARDTKLLVLSTWLGLIYFISTVDTVK